MVPRDPRVREVKVVVEALVLETGHWCGPCAIPSGIRQIVAVTSPSGAHLQSAVRCVDCNGTTVHLTPERVGYGDRSV